MRKPFYILLLLIAFASCGEKISDFQGTNFIKLFGSGNGSFIASVLELEGEGYIFTGYDITSNRKHVFYAKTDVHGNTLWEKTIEKDSVQEGTVIKQFDSESLLNIGNTQITSSSVVNPLLVKIDRNGDTLWTRVILRNYKLVVNDFVVSKGKVYMVGETNVFSKADGYIACIDESGTLVEKSPNPLGTVQSSYRRAILPNDGTLIVFGDTKPISGVVTKTQVAVFSLDRIQSNPSNYIELPASENQLLTGVISSGGDYYLQVYNESGSLETRVIKLNGAFSKVWETGKLTPFKGKAITLWPDGSLFTGGDSNSEFSVKQIDGQGNIIGADYKSYPGVAGTIITTSDNGVLLAGATASGSGSMAQLIKTGSDLFLLKR